MEKIRASLHRLISNQNAMAAGVILRKAVWIKPPGVQMCNRLRNLMAGTILGTLTDRAVLYPFNEGFKGTFESLFDTPLSLNAFPHSSVGGSIVSGPHDYDNALCNDWINDYNKSATLLINHHTWITPLLYLNTALQPRFDRELGGLRGTYKAIFVNLFMPSLNVRNRIEEFYKQHALYSTSLVAIHLRTGPDFRPPATDEDWARYGRCADAMTKRVQRRKQGAAKTQATWFVAADTLEARERAAKEFAKYGAKLIYYSDYMRSNNEEGVQRALTELLMLAIADARVLTPASSYSEFAFSLAGPDSDSVFVESNAPKGPPFTYPYSTALAPNCKRPTSADPSLSDLKSYVQNSVCVKGEPPGVATALLEKAENLYKR